MQTATLLSRRALLVGFLSLPVVAQAHSGHKHARVTIEVLGVKVKDGVVRLDLSLVNTRSTPVRLFRISAEGAPPVVFETPFEVAGFGTGELRASLVFSGPVPDTFGAALDFGEHGQDRVLVATRR